MLISHSFLHISFDIPLLIASAASFINVTTLWNADRDSCRLLSKNQYTAVRTIHIVYPAVSLAVCNIARPIAESGSSRDASWRALREKRVRALRQHKIETFPTANRVHKGLKINPSHLERKKDPSLLSSRAILSLTSGDRYSLHCSEATSSR